MSVCVLSAAIYNSLQKYLMEIAAATNVQPRYVASVVIALFIITCTLINLLIR